MDVIDVAQRRQQEEIDHAISARQRVRSLGLPACERFDCGEPITEFRQSLGARLCVDCQRNAEARACTRRGV